MFYENNLAKLSGPKYLLKVSFFGNGSVALTSTAWRTFTNQYTVGQYSRLAYNLYQCPLTVIVIQLCQFNIKEQSTLVLIQYKSSNAPSR